MLTPAPTTAASTYTTIPVPLSSAISRSYDNLSTALSRHRPWSEFLSSLSSPPDSVSAATSRLRTNAKHFFINYAVVVSSVTALSLLVNDPFALLLYSLLSATWLLLQLFREDPVIVYGRHVDDWIVIVGLIGASVLVVWSIGMVSVITIGIILGLVVCGVHGVFRDPEGLFLDEEDAVSNGLIVPGPVASGSPRKDFYP